MSHLSRSQDDLLRESNPNAKLPIKKQLPDSKNSKKRLI